MDIADDADRLQTLLYSAYDSDTVREMERPLLDDGVPLMRMAASAAAHVTMTLLDDEDLAVEDARVALLVGAGDNGGDGLYAGAELANEVDFFSVGTNDLTQYTLAVDRQGVGLDRFFDAHHPAVLRMIRMAAENAHKAGIWIGICGELGADAELTETFLSMGIDELSVSPSAVLPLRSAIRSIDTTTLAPLEL